MSHPSDDLFERMRSVVEAPGYPLLTHYKQDFYKHDRQALIEMFAPGMAFLWIVRAYGTHLTPLYIDRRYSAESLAALKLDGEARTYLVSGTGVHQVTYDKAKSELARFDYEVRNGFVVKKDGANLGRIDCAIRHTQKGQTAAILFSGDRALESLSARDIIALKRIALAQAIERSQSLFTRVEEVSYNGQNILAPRAEEQEACAA